MTFLRVLSIRSFARSAVAAVVLLGFFATVAPTVTHAEVSLLVDFTATEPQSVQNIPWTQGMTALGALVQVQHDKMPLQPSGVQLSTLWQFFLLKDVPPPQPFLFSINGLAGSSTFFWAFLINGQPAKVGLAQFVLSDGDKIALVFEKIN